MCVCNPHLPGTWLEEGGHGDLGSGLYIDLAAKMVKPGQELEARAIKMLQRTLPRPLGKVAEQGKQACRPEERPQSSASHEMGGGRRGGSLVSFIHTDSRSAHCAQTSPGSSSLLGALACRGHSSLKVNQEWGREGQGCVFQEG